jgi:hypothetical protein
LQVRALAGEQWVALHMPASRAGNRIAPFRILRDR